MLAVLLKVCVLLMVSKNTISNPYCLCDDTQGTVSKPDLVKHLCMFKATDISSVSPEYYRAQYLYQGSVPQQNVKLDFSVYSCILVQKSPI